MASPAIERLREIKTLPQLVAYLRDELDWPISSNNTEDITFDYEPSELGLDKETAVKIKERLGSCDHSPGISRGESSL